MASFIISISALQRNTTVLREIREAADCKLVLALKGFACWRTFPHIRDQLDGCCASGIWEAQLASNHFGKRVITYSPAYRDEEVAQLLNLTTHLDFNSLSQWQRFRETVIAHPRFKSGDLHCGLRINPEHSSARTPLYDPCAAGSRLGITADQLVDADLSGLSGLHFHTLCEQNSDALESTLVAIDEKFGDLLRRPQFNYFNLGGGHWITKPEYDRPRLIRLIREVSENYGVQVWLEPGEAVAVHTGVLRAEVLDVFESAGHRHAILDVSATAHMPDILEMPYRPDVFLVDAGAPKSQMTDAPAVTFQGESYLLATDPSSEADPDASQVVHRLAGPSCLAGDVIGDYAFPRLLVPGDCLIFDDMAHYTMVKTTTFNGVQHPDIVLQHPDGRLETVRKFRFEDFRDRLA